MKTKKIKAKRYWKTASGTFLHPAKKSAQYFSGFNAAEVAPVVVLPADAGSVEAMVDQANIGITMSLSDGRSGVTSRELARAALSSIGIHSRAPKS